MIRFSLATALLLSTASTAFAGPVDVPAPPPPVIVLADDPFDGFYAGLEIGYGFSEARQDEENGGTGGFGDYDPDDGLVWGGFAGYNFQNGSLVYSGEVRYLHLDIEDPVALFTIENVFDVRARLGFAASDAILLYGAVGYSSASAELGAASFDLTGLNYGLGAEYNVNESIFVGVDYTGRMLEGSNGGFDYEADVNTATFRVGFRF